MNTQTIQKYGDELFEAMRSRTTVVPLTAREPSITISDAYHISKHTWLRREALGERLIGKKIGVTSLAVQSALGVFQPDFGYLSDTMLCDWSAVPIGSRLIQPRAEGEIAFRLGKTLKGPGITEADVLSATAYVTPCFEIVDSRIHDWQIKICDTIADNASSGLFVLGKAKADPRAVDFVNCKMRVEKNGRPLSEGVGAAALGSPVKCVAWLANTLGELGVELVAGEIILSGSLVPLEAVRPGDKMSLTIDGVGDCSISFC